MKKSILKTLAVCVLSLFVHCINVAAQSGYLTTIAGTGSATYSGDGGLATAATINSPLGVSVDIVGNIYIADYANHRVRKISTSGIITTVAGGGLSTAENVPATSASIVPTGVSVDPTGNVYIVDQANNRIRKVNTAGMITTIAGTGTLGFAGDGGPAVLAQLNNPHSMCLDLAGNIFIGDEGNDRIRRIDAATGIITTYAGTGVYGYSGDGGPATLATLQYPDGVFSDNTGNLYIADRFNHCVRKVNTSGIISTVAGGNGAGFSGDGGPASFASLYQPSTICVDNVGNLYIGDYMNSRVRIVNQSGNIFTYAGGGSSMSVGIPATTALFSNLWGVSIDGYNNIYIADKNNNRICKVAATVITSPGNTFGGYNSSYDCSAPQFSCIKNPYSAGLTGKIYYGDGTSSSAAINNTISGMGMAMYNHAYANTGNYTVKHVLYNATAAIDSVQYTYHYTFCKTFTFQIFFNGSGTCTYTPGSMPLNAASVRVEVRKNGVAIDTVTATSGFYYTAANANQGDIYAFKILNPPTGMYVSCPSTGIIYDTAQIGSAPPTKNFGLSCTSSNAFDVSTSGHIQVTGVWDQGGNIYVHSNSCAPVNATVTLRFSPKYAYAGWAIPTPSSVSGNTITWNLNNLTSGSSSPSISLHYFLWSASGSMLTIGDTVKTTIDITPTAGDGDSTNNHWVKIDTVKAGCDPNDMYVSPKGNILPCTKMRYTIDFENTGNDTAHNIYVMDTLSNDLDISTLNIEMSSHTMFLSTINYGNQKILKFEFPSINLLDSSHHDQCTGMLVYTINTKQNVANNTVVQNRAGIYFDVNDVVMTNSVMNTIVTQPAITGNTSICSGTTQVYNLGTEIGGINSYSWTLPNSWTGNSNTSTIAINSGSAGGNVSLIMTGACGSYSSAPLTVAVYNTSPQISAITGSSVVCAGSSSVYTINPVPGATSYLWTTPTGWTSTTNGTTLNVNTGTGSGNITVSVGDLCGQTGTQTLQVTTTTNVPSQPGGITGNLNVCAGSTQTFSIASVTGANNYTWTLPNGWTGSSATNTVNVTAGSSSGAVSVTANNVCGSSVAQTIPVNITAIPAQPASITGNTSICPNSVQQYSIMPVAGATGYTWQMPNGWTGNSATEQVTVQSNTIGGNVTVRANNNCGVSALQTLPIAINIVPAPVVSSPIRLCLGQTEIPLTATGSNLLWYTNANGTNGSSVAPIVSGSSLGSTYWFVSQTVGGCVGQIAGIEVQTVPLPTPSVSVNGNVLSTGIYNSYQWYMNGSAIAGATNSSYTIQGPGQYYVAVTDSNGCIGRSLSSSLGIGGIIMIENGVQVYPSPAHNNIYIQTTEKYDTYTIINSIGQTILHQPLNSTQTTVDVTMLPAGVYQVLLQNGTGTAVKRFVKM
jgi:hypothetical protein